MDPESWDQEVRRELQQRIDPLCHDIIRRRVDSWEARKRWGQIRTELALKVPGQIELIDMIYGSRVNRLIEQFAIPVEADETISEIL